MKRVLLQLMFVLNPWRWLMRLRRSLTAASVTLLLVGIVSLNIVWGYPWTGMFAACASLFVIGWLVNYFASPLLKASVSAPRWVPVGTQLSVPSRLSNEGRWPGMDLRFEGRQSCDWIGPRDEITIMKDVRFATRGIHPLPPILVDSYFPFYLFRTSSRIDPRTSIAVTPAPLSREDDELWRSLESTLKGIAARCSHGDHVHYIGSVEYREGIPVRRWDFSSWARLGKPILREFSTPAARSVSIWIDNVCADLPRPRPNPVRRWLGGDDATIVHEPFERILSIAASSIMTLVRNGAAVTLWITPGQTVESLRCEAGGDPSELLIALSSLARVDSDMIDRASDDQLPSSRSRRCVQEIRTVNSEALLVVSCRGRAEVNVELPTGTRWITDQKVETLDENEAVVVSRESA